jgi:hypothetical protein
VSLLEVNTDNLPKGMAWLCMFWLAVGIIILLVTDWQVVVSQEQTYPLGYGIIISAIGSIVIGVFYISFREKKS